MKKILLTLMVLTGLGASTAFSQVCTPDPFVQLIGIPGIYPSVLQNADLPDATLGQPYSTTLTILVVGDTTVDLSTLIPFPGAPTVNVDVEDQRVNNLTGLPPGLSYACSPPSCIIKGDSIGCVVITGTPTQAGDFQPNLDTEIGFILPTSLPAPFGGSTQYGPIPGQDYQMRVQDTTMVSATPINDNSFVAVQNMPNPFRGSTDISFSAPRPMAIEFTVTDLSGKILTNEHHNAAAGSNKITFNANGISPGIYFYTLSNGSQSVTSKMVITE